MEFFVHIPKTAGSTLRHILDAQYGKSNVILFYNQRSQSLLDNLGPYVAARPHRAMIGHFPYGLHERITGNSRYITFLRDPVALVASTYDEILKAHGREDYMRDVVENRLPLEEAIARYRYDFLNIQSTYLSQHFPDGDRPETAEDANAIKSLLGSGFDFVGLVERFDESVLMLGRILGWRPFLYRRQNVSGPRAPMSAPLRAAIDGLTACDRALYDWAAARFDAVAAAQPPEFFLALAELKSALADMSANPPANTAEVLIEGIELPAVAEYLATGSAAS